MRIIYKNLDNSVGILTPTQEAINMIIDAKTTDWDNPFALNEALFIIAEKDVPSPIKVYDIPTGVFEIDEDTQEEYEVMGSRIVGFPYKIVPVDTIPTDRTFRNAWEWDNSIEPDGFGGESNEFDAKLLANYKQEQGA